MPRHCSVSGCRSNYHTETEKVSTFALPKTEPLRSQWLESIPTDFSKIRNPIVCLKHFDESSIIRTDIATVKGVQKEYPRKIPKLKDGSFPTIFPNMQSHSNIPFSSPKRFVDAEYVNLQRTINESLIESKKCQEKDTIHSIKDISLYLTEKVKLDKWTHLIDCEKITICYINTQNECPTILGCVIVTSLLNISVYIDKRKIENNMLPERVTHLNSFSILDSIMSFVEEISNKPEDLDLVNYAISVLILHRDFEDSDHLNFIIEQLKLYKMPKNNRRYSDETMIFASSLYLRSHTAYNALLKCEFLCLPHPRNLQKFISGGCLHGSLDI